MFSLPLSGLLLPIIMLGGLCSGQSGFASSVIIGTSQEPDSLHPILSTMSASLQVRNMVLRPVMAIEQTSKKLRCFLCTDLPVKGRDRKGRFVVRWQIRQDAFWGDGQPVTGRDMRLAWEIGSEKNIANPSREPFEKILDVELDAKDPKVFSFVYDSPRYDALYIDINFVPMPSHIEGPIFARTRKSADRYEKESAYVRDPFNPGLYNGPFLVKEHVPGSLYKLVRNPFFKGRVPELDSVLFRVVADTSMWVQLQAGDIDMTAPTTGISAEQALSLEQLAAKNPAQASFDFLWNPNLTVEKIAFNMSVSPTDDPAVRRALMLAIDRKALVDSLFRARFSPAFHPYHESSPYRSGTPLPNGDLQKAAEILTSTGWLPGPDGVRRKGDARLALTLSATANNKTRELIEVVLQEAWKKIGAAVTIRNELARQYYGRTLWRREYGHVALFATNLWNVEDILLGSYHSKNIPEAANNWSGGNVMGWRNPPVDKTLEKAVETVQVQERAKLLGAVADEFAKEVPAVPLFHYANVVVARKGLTFGSDHAFPDPLFVEEWARAPAGALNHLR